MSKKCANHTIILGIKKELTNLSICQLFVFPYQNDAILRCHNMTADADVIDQAGEEIACIEVFRSANVQTPIRMYTSQLWYLQQQEFHPHIIT